MTSRLPDNGFDPTRFLPVLTPQQRQNQQGVHQRGRSHDFSADLEGRHQEEDIVDVTALEDGESGGLVHHVGESLHQPPRHHAQSQQNRHQQQQTHHFESGDESLHTQAEIATAVYRFHDEAPGRPFHLGRDLDIVG